MNGMTKNRYYQSKMGDPNGPERTEGGEKS